MECYYQLLLVYFEMRCPKVLSSCLLLAAALALSAGELCQILICWVFLKVYSVVLVNAATDGDPGYLLYTRRNRNTSQRIEPSVEALLRSSFYALDPVV